MTALSAVLLLVALLPSGGPPEVVIRGQVVDPAGAAIAGANVRVLDEASRNTIDTESSDKDGKFSISGLAEGVYLLAVSAPGFQEKLVRVDQSEDGTRDLPAVQLDKLDCDAPGANCDRSATGDVDDAHPAILTRDMTVRADQAVDLQNGDLVSRDSSKADIRLDSAAGTLFVVPLNGAAFTTSGAGGSCGKTRNKDPLRIDGRGPASEIVVLSGHKQCSRLFITSEIAPGSDQASFHVVTRSR
jgi:hypothetical protein